MISEKGGQSGVTQYQQEGARHERRTAELGRRGLSGPRRRHPGDRLPDRAKRRPVEGVDSDDSGGEVILEDNPCTVKLANSWIIMNFGEGRRPISRTSRSFPTSPRTRSRPSSTSGSPTSRPATATGRPRERSSSPSRSTASPRCASHARPRRLSDRGRSGNRNPRGKVREEAARGPARLGAPPHHATNFYVSRVRARKTGVLVEVDCYLPLRRRGSSTPAGESGQNTVARKPFLRSIALVAVVKGS